jgi:hypothetical protein
MTQSTSEAGWDEHDHDRMVHSHRHYHVTHHVQEEGGSLEHLSSAHEHEHDHAALHHAHAPHQDVAHEHVAEVHVHDHQQPTHRGGQSGEAL